MSNEIVFEQRGPNLRFILPKRVPYDDFRWIIDRDDVWYYPENGYIYLKPRMKVEVLRILTNLGFTTPLSTQNGTQAKKSTSTILAKDIRVVSKIKRLFKIKSQHICNAHTPDGSCQNRTQWDRQRRLFRCSEHGARWRAKKVWYFTGLLDLEGESQLALLTGDCFTGLLRKIKMRKREIDDAVKGLKGDLYFEQLRQIKEAVTARVEELDREYGFFGDMVEWKPTDADTVVVFFKATKTMSDREQKTVQGAEKFIAGEFDAIKRIAEEVLPEFDLTVKTFGNLIPVVVLTKPIGNDVIEVRIRAPVGEYGKAYHLSMRVNDVLMFPAAPVVIKVWGQPFESWTWRVFHTKGWMERIREWLEYIGKMESRALALVNQAKNIRDFEAGVLIGDLDLSDKAKKAILEQWTGGTLMEFCQLVASRNPTEALRAFQKAIKVIYKTDYKRWVLQTTDLNEDDLMEVPLRSPRIGESSE